MMATPQQHIAQHLLLETTIVGVFSLLFTILVGEENHVALEEGPVTRRTIPLYQWVVISLVAIAMAISGFKKRQLTFSGSIAAFIVGVANGVLGVRFFLVLCIFYKTSSMLTKWRMDEKRKLDSEGNETGGRSAKQVLSCSLLGTYIAGLRWYHCGNDSMVDFGADPYGSFLLCAYIGFYACCTGDTWSSEYGVLSRKKPVLITKPWRTVPPGTNGGVSLPGTMASIAGGFTIGFSFWLLGVILPLFSHLALPSQLPALLLGVIGGLGGSLIDSLIGAIAQATYYDYSQKKVIKLNDAKSKVNSSSVKKICGMDWLSNEQVNSTSACLTVFTFISVLHCKKEEKERSNCVRVPRFQSDNG